MLRRVSFPVTLEPAITRQRSFFIATAILLAAASLGLSIFGGLAWRAVTVSRRDATAAAGRFAEIRSHLQDSPALVQRDASGRLIRRDRPPRGDSPPTRLKVIAY